MISKIICRWLMLSFFWLMCANVASAQTNIGLRISPTIMYNRLGNLPDTIRIESEGVSFRPVVGLFFDFPVGYQYYFSTGINFVSKPISLTRSTTLDTNVKEKYILQYLQIPISLKLFTSEVALDKKLYIQVGSLIDIKIHEEEKSGAARNLIEFKTAGMTLNLGVGMEFRLGAHTFLQTGLSYNRGLTNIVDNSQISEDLSIKNDMVSIDLSLTF